MARRLLVEHNFFYLIGIDKPEISLDMGMSHVGQELHIFPNLVVIFVFRTTEFEVDHYPFLTIGHHTVRASFYDFTVLNGKNGTLIEKFPTI
jgi:hypothetical protein